MDESLRPSILVCAQHSFMVTSMNEPTKAQVRAFGDIASNLTVPIHSLQIKEYRVTLFLAHLISIRDYLDLESMFLIYPKPSPYSF